MRNAHPKYLCYPSVVRSGVETTVTIYPMDTSRRFLEGGNYELNVYGLMDDQIDYHTPSPLDHPFTVEGGCLKFTHFFNKEQEYRVRLKVDGVMNNLSMFALEEDLYALRPLKGDFHSHCWYSDGGDGLSMTPADYREEGFDFFALTDHNRMFTSRLAQTMYDGVELGMTILPGEELHTPGANLHIVHVGGKESICEKYINDAATFESEVAALEENLQRIPQQYRNRIAMAKWSCSKIHEAEGIAIFAHPYWQPDQFNISADQANYLFSEKMFDAFELVGGCKNRDNNLQVALWQEQCMKGNVLSVVGSSDSHDHDNENVAFARRFTIAFARENTTEAILEAIRNGYSVAAELPPTSNEDVRFFGSLRLVTLCHFLWQHYFSRTWRLCIGEGILMRRWAHGEDVGEVLSALAPTVENFYKRFYGLTPAPQLTARQTEFLDRALEAQKAGPITKGSKLYLYGTNARRE